MYSSSQDASTQRPAGRAFHYTAALFHERSLRTCCHPRKTFEAFRAARTSQAALVGFDAKPHLIRDFTHKSEEVNEELKHLQPGKGGAAILDTVSYAVDLLETQPKEYRRVLLLISEQRDHGSK